jgi:cytochrome c-type biogenesis protein CcmH
VSTGGAVSPGSAARRRQRNALGWAALLVVVVTALAVGVFSGRTAQTNQERVADLSKEIACPVCGGESVAQSNAPAAVNIRNEIGRQVDAGRTDDEIRTYLAQQFGEDQLLRPRGEGVSALVWVLPVAAVVVAAAGLVLAFRRWGATADIGTPTEEDRQLVAHFLAADDVGEIPSDPGGGGSALSSPAATAAGPGVTATTAAPGAASAGAASPDGGSPAGGTT